MPPSRGASPAAAGSGWRSPLRSTALNEIAAGVSVKNTGDKAVWRTVSATGVPAAPMPAFGDGVSVSKSYYNLDGTPANLGALKQNDQVVVVIEGELKDRSFRQMALKFVELPQLKAFWS